MKKKVLAAVIAAMCFGSTIPASVPMTVSIAAESETAQTVRDMNPDDVLELSKKGKKISWSDFDGFNVKWRSTIAYTRFAKIEMGNDLFLVVGGEPSSRPEVVWLCYKDTENYVDVKTGDVQAFLKENNYVPAATTTTTAVTTTTTTAAATTTTTKASATTVTTTAVTTTAATTTTVLTEARTMTLDDVVTLSKKGDALDWSDFEPYKYHDASTCIQCWEYDLGDGFHLKVGGPPDSKPDFILLGYYSFKDCDVREDDVSAFIDFITSTYIIIKGDANFDRHVDMSDVVLVMQAMANPNKYGLNGTDEKHLTEQGMANADMDGNGLTVADALAIQRKLLHISDIDRSVIAGKTFVYEKEGFGSDFEITFNEDGTYIYSPGVLSSYLGSGTWEIEDEYVYMAENTSDNVNYLKINGSALVYRGAGSDNFNGFKVKDGEVFYLKTDNGDLTASSENKKTMTLDDIKALAKKGGELTWSDFEAYSGRKCGTPFDMLAYIYEIDESYYLSVSGAVDGAPDQVQLCHYNEHISVDVLTGDVEAFIAEYSNYELPDIGYTFDKIYNMTEDEVRTVFNEKGLTDTEKYHVYPQRNGNTAVDNDSMTILLYPENYMINLTDHELVSHVTDMNDRDKLFKDSDIVWDSEKVRKSLGLPEEYFNIYVESSMTVTKSAPEGEAPDIRKYCKCSIRCKSDDKEKIADLRRAALNYIQLNPDFALVYHETSGGGNDAKMFLNERTSYTNEDTNLRTFTVLDIYDTYVIVSADGSRYYDRYFLYKKYIDSDIDPVPGMKLTFGYTETLDTYPGQFGGVHDVKVVSEDAGLIKGDSNCDGQVDMADVVFIMQALANPDRFGEKAPEYIGITELGKLNGDMNGDGLTVGDAQAIQLKLLGIVENESPVIKLNTLIPEQGTDYVELKPDEPMVSCYDPVLNSLDGVGVWFELASQQSPVTLTADKGSFKVFTYKNGGLGTVDDVGKTCELDKSGEVSWVPETLTVPDDYEEKIHITDSKNADLGTLVITKNPKSGEGVFCVTLKKSNTSANSQSFPKLSDIVTIDNDYFKNKSNQGIGISLDFDSKDYPIALTAAEGGFVVENTDSSTGKYKILGNTCKVGKNGMVIWEPLENYMSYDYEFNFSPERLDIEVLVEAIDGDRRIELGKIYIAQVERTKFTASLDAKDVSPYRAVIADKTYVYEKEGAGSDFEITFNADGTYRYYEGTLSSSGGSGTWKITDDTVIMTEKISKKVNYLKINGSDLIFIADGSDNFYYINVEDGDKFFVKAEEKQPALSDIVTIKTDYDPVMSDWSGIGILLEFDSPEYAITLEADDGQFVEWDTIKGSGPIKNEGKTYEIGKSGSIFWDPDDMCYTDGLVNEITVKGTKGGKQVELGKIFITHNDRLVFTASLEKPEISALDNIRKQLSEFFAAEKIDYTVIPKIKMPDQFKDKYVFIKVNTADTSYAVRYDAFLKENNIDSSLIKSIPYKIDSDTELNKIRALLYCYILENNINASVDPTNEEADLKNKTVLVKYADSANTRTQLENFLKEKNIDLKLVEFFAVE